jgi:hypothetical protein
LPALSYGLVLKLTRSGSEAVDFFLAASAVQTREEGVSFGQALMDRSIFYNAVSAAEPFQDKPTAFYRFYQVLSRSRSVCSCDAGCS